eukprot:jgi/Mesen1/8927/ME000548S08432
MSITYSNALRALLCGRTRRSPASTSSEKGKPKAGRGPRACRALPWIDLPALVTPPSASQGGVNAKFMVLSTAVAASTNARGGQQTARAVALTCREKEPYLPAARTPAPLRGLPVTDSTTLSAALEGPPLESAAQQALQLSHSLAAWRRRRGRRRAVLPQDSTGEHAAKGRWNGSGLRWGRGCCGGPDLTPMSFGPVPRTSFAFTSSPSMRLEMALRERGDGGAYQQQAEETGGRTGDGLRQQVDSRQSKSQSLRQQVAGPEAEAARQAGRSDLAMDGYFTRPCWRSWPSWSRSRAIAADEVHPAAMEPPPPEALQRRHWSSGGRPKKEPAGVGAGAAAGGRDEGEEAEEL